MSAADTMAPLRVAVIGHTNAGKTSLLRTLLRQGGFGEVANAPGTTRHVEAASLLVAGNPVLTLIDTPGLEDCAGLLQLLGQDQKVALPDCQPAHLINLVQKHRGHCELDQEIKVIAQIIQADILLAVIDVREPVMARYEDELKLMRAACRPLIPVLNFTRASSESTELWQQSLIRLNLHASVTFDNVAFRFEDEIKLLRKIQSLLPLREAQIETLIDSRQQHWLQQSAQAAEQIADAFIKLAALRIRAKDSQNPAESLSEKVELLDQRTRSKVLALYQFSQDDVRVQALPVLEDWWAGRLLDPVQLRKFGREASRDVARGAAVGAGFDVAVAGLSLGVGTAIGAVSGLVYRSGRRFGPWLSQRLGRQAFYSVSEETLAHFWDRHLFLLRTLRGRGHAAVTPSTYEPSGFPLPEGIAGVVPTLRSNPEWAADDLADSDRKQALQNIAQEMLSGLAKT